MKKTFLIFSLATICVLPLSAQPNFKQSGNAKELKVESVKPNSLLTSHSFSTKSDKSEPVSKQTVSVAHNDITGFQTTPNGLLYKFERQAPNRKQAKPGDLAHLHVEFWIGDSLIFNTKTLNGQNPVPEEIKEVNYAGDVSEGIQMLSPGDIAVFKTSVQNLAQNGKGALPQFAKADDYATWRIEMTDLKTQEELKMEEEKLREKEDQAIRAYMAEHKMKGEKLPSGVYIVTHQEGVGETPRDGQTISVNYTGKLLNGTLFDSNVDPQFNHVAPIKFPVGQRRVIKGWDEAFKVMRPGQKATIIIPSALAYGKQSPTPAIPANSVLVFDVEFLSIEK